MRVKPLLAPLGLAVAVALAIPGVSDASRGGAEPVEEPAPESEEPIDEDPVVEAEEDPTPEPEAVEPEAEEPEAEEPEAEEPEAEEPEAEEPEAEEPEAEEPEAEEPEAEEPEAEEPEADVVDDPVVTQGRPDVAEERESDNRRSDGGACHMDDFESWESDDLEADGEVDRAEKVDRNGNGTVCRKDIPGKGRGNTGEGTNIKDDHAR